MTDPRQTKTSHGSQPRKFRLLGYALPQPPDDNAERSLEHESFIVHDVPLRSNVRFQDYDGLIVFAGAFEKCTNTDSPDRFLVSCIDRADLDLRERQTLTLIDQRKPVVFLLRFAPRYPVNSHEPADQDLFRRISSRLGIKWVSYSQATPVDWLAPDFKTYAMSFGTGYILLRCDEQTREPTTPLFGSDRLLFGAAVKDTVFFLPCPNPQNLHVVQQTVLAAIEGVLGYRERMSEDMPEWVSEFQFEKESSLRVELEGLVESARRLGTGIREYKQCKGALVFQSKPLVDIVAHAFRRFFGISLVIDDKCIEDATIRDSQGDILAVLEIKGVRGNFKGANVNQVDTHRERLGLNTETPGILITNTFMEAKNFKEKDERPHPDIVKKATRENVLILRTLDLIRLANLVEKGCVSTAEAKNMFLKSAGWLRADEHSVQVEQV